jgi:hypothetical protein
MRSLFDTLSRRLDRVRKSRERAGPSRAFRCQCGRSVFFRNTTCLACNTPLGFEPVSGTMTALVPAALEGRWQLHGHSGEGEPLYHRCENFDNVGCNWLLPDEETERCGGLCIACRMNRTIPDLSEPDNLRLWRRTEIAKRRMVAQLLALGLPVQSRLTDNAEQGLMFDLLRAAPGAPNIMTGHLDGLITINLEEADDFRREQIRQALHEPYRTLLGHFRHEVGHYYWDRLVLHTRWLEPFRVRFGDERADYLGALQRHYEFGPEPEWSQRCVSAYACTHPWEDWAETWAHYMHMVDTVNTALRFGLEPAEMDLEIDPYTLQSMDATEGRGARKFLNFINGWLQLTTMLNELSRSMGQHDFYPFVLSQAAVAKLYFVHQVVSASRKA